MALFYGPSFIALALTLALHAGETASLPTGRPYVVLARSDENEVRRKAEANPGLVPYEFVLPSKSGRDKLAIVGSWSDYKERHCMHKQDDLCRVTLLLPPGKFDFQVYRNGKLASQKTHSLRTGAAGLARFLPSAQTTLICSILVLLFVHGSLHRAELLDFARSIWTSLLPLLARDQKGRAPAPFIAKSSSAHAATNPSVTGLQGGNQKSGEEALPPHNTKTILDNALTSFKEENPLAGLFGAATSAF